MRSTPQGPDEERFYPRHTEEKKERVLTPVVRDGLQGESGASSIVEFPGYKIVAAFLARIFPLSDLMRNSSQARAVPKPGKVFGLVIQTVLAPCSPIALSPRAGKNPETFLLTQDRHLSSLAQWSSRHNAPALSASSGNLL